MEDLVLISTATSTETENTRSQFENILPSTINKKFSCICLKELYFQAKFVSIARQTRPHITFCVDHTVNGFHFSEIENISDLFQLNPTSPSKNDTYEIVSKHIEPGPFLKTTTVFTFGTCIETKMANNTIVEVTFVSSRIESVNRMIGILNFILKFHKFEFNLEFSITATQNIFYSCIESAVIIDSVFGKFLGYDDTKQLALTENFITFTDFAENNESILSTYRTTMSEYFIQSCSIKKRSEVKKKVFFTASSHLNPDVFVPDRVMIECSLVDAQLYNTCLLYTSPSPRD